MTLGPSITLHTVCGLVDPRPLQYYSWYLSSESETRRSQNSSLFITTLPLIDSQTQSSQHIFCLSTTQVRIPSQQFFFYSSIPKTNTLHNISFTHRFPNTFFTAHLSFADYTSKNSFTTSLLSVEITNQAPFSTILVDSQIIHSSHTFKQ